MSPEERAMHLILDDFRTNIKEEFTEIKNEISREIQEDRRQREEFRKQLRPLLEWFNSYSTGKKLIMSLLKMIIFASVFVGAVFALYAAFTKGVPPTSLGQ